MKRICLLAGLVGALAVLTLGVPAAALAGGYSWNLASDFTAVAPGANPDHDQYGATPWSYAESSASGLHDPSAFSPLPTFVTGVEGGLVAWQDQSSGALLGLNPTSVSISDGSNTFPAGQVVVEPGSGQTFVAIGWTSPFSQTANVTVSSSISSDSSATSPLCAPATWSLDQDAVPLDSGVTPASASTSFTTSVVVNPGAALYLTISPPAGDPSCDATGLSFQVRASGSAPAVTLTNPASGAANVPPQPTFSGAAATGFGVSNQITLRIYAGSAASGAPVQSLTATASGGTWSAKPTSPLTNGVYTAQAEQDDRASPTDAGFSAASTVTVSDPPQVTLVSPGSKPLATHTPTLTGTAGAAPGDDPHAFIHVYAGGTSSGPQVQDLKATIAGDGTYSAQVNPALADGIYTAVAMQGDQSGNVGASAPVTFRIDTRAPAVTLLRPSSNSRSDSVSLVFAGRVGTALGDFGTVAVLVYRGSEAKGRPLARINVKASGSSWSARWAGTLAPGVYTARAAQHDDAGHTGLSAAHTFRVLPPPRVIGPVLTIDAAGRVSLKIACVEPPGDTCSGTVRVLTKGSFQPRPGGPFGRLSVIFAHVNIEGGHNHTISRVAPALVVGVLRSLATVPVTISANLRPMTGKAIHATERAELRHK
ncbi:MAG TPA: Ig-like domain-containing protein [Solirubrobacteraceae bacterium]|nr:Ig-like domain-containing protein [Solirubrobacteraceae bacterium]